MAGKNRVGTDVELFGRENRERKIVQYGIAWLYLDERSLKYIRIKAFCEKHCLGARRGVQFPYGSEGSAAAGTPVFLIQPPNSGLRRGAEPSLKLDGVDDGLISKQSV